MESEKQRRLLRSHRQRRDAPAAPKQPRTVAHTGMYHDHYKQLLLITLFLLLASIAVIAYTHATTGSFFYKGVSLSGGMTLTIGTEGLEPVNVAALESDLRSRFSQNDVHVREISEFGTQQGVAIEATTPDNTQQSLDALGTQILDATGIPGAASRATTEITGPSLGASFLQQTLKAIMIAFFSMGLVVFMYFGDRAWQKATVIALTLIEAFVIWHATGPLMITLAIIIGGVLVAFYARYSIPSTAVILAAFSTLLFTIAVLDILQMRVSTAGIAAFLMLIGYSVDTDILLSTRVLKSSTGTVYERVVGTMKTGLTMTLTTLAAALISLLFTQSDVIREIMIIICIGLVADIFFTWIQNAGILRWYLEKKGRGSDDQ
jgi:preprotein translocase subunit SecF